MSRRDARVERKAAKQLKQAAKSVRLKASVRDSMPPPKTPRAGADPNSIFQMTMTWTAERADCEGAWGWGTPRQWTQDAWDNSVQPKLEQWEALTWGEIDRFTSGNGHKMHHSMPIEVICGEAQTRLIEIDQVDESIFRFRLGNLPRLWGFRRVSEFQILWFDPFHEIYPTDIE